MSIIVGYGVFLALGLFASWLGNIFHTRCPKCKSFKSKSELIPANVKAGRLFDRTVYTCTRCQHKWD